MRNRGFTLMEVLIVVAILMLLLMVTLLNLRGQIAHAQDSKRKMDLYTLRKSFEDYYNDYNAFPDQSVVNNCGSAGLAPYLTQVPCDPASRSHYGYFRSVSGGYRICAKLSDTTDPAIVEIGCGSSLGCGLGGGYNYCLGSGVTASAVGTADEIFDGGGPSGSTETPAPTSPSGGGPSGGGTPGPTPNLNPANHVVCSNGGACVWFSIPADHGCTVSWESDCPGFIHSPETPFSGACNDPLNRCTGG